MNSTIGMRHAPAALPLDWYFLIFIRGRPACKCRLFFSWYGSNSLDFHAGGEAVGYPYCRTKKQPTDSLWYEQEGKRYADLVHDYGPSGYFDDFGGKGYGKGYLMLPGVKGIRVDYVPYYCHCLCYGFELTKTKLMPESQFLTYWGYHREALISAFEQVLYGIRGVVTDSITGEGVPAKIVVNDQTTDSSHFYSNMPHGDFYRPIFRGTYSLTFTSDEYYPRTVENITVATQSVTEVNVKLFPKNTSSAITDGHVQRGITLVPYRKGYRIFYDEPDNLENISIYDVSGKEIRSFSFSSQNTTGSIVWNGTNNAGQRVGRGCYIIRFRTKQKLQVSRLVTM